MSPRKSVAKDKAPATQADDPEMQDGAEQSAEVVTLSVEQHEETMRLLEQGMDFISKLPHQNPHTQDWVKRANALVHPEDAIAEAAQLAAAEEAAAEDAAAEAADHEVREARATAERVKAEEELVKKEAAAKKATAAAAAKRAEAARAAADKLKG